MKKALSSMLAAAMLLSQISVFAADPVAVTGNGKTFDGGSASDGKTYIIDDFSGLHGHITDGTNKAYDMEDIITEDAASTGSYTIYNAIADAGWNMEGTSVAPPNVSVKSSASYAQNARPAAGRLWVYNRDTNKVVNGWTYRDSSSALMLRGETGGSAYVSPSQQVSNGSTTTVSPKYLDFDIETEENSDKALVISYDARITGNASIHATISEIADDGNGNYKNDTWSEMFKMPSLVYSGGNVQIHPYRVKPTDGYGPSANVTNHPAGTAIDPSKMLIFKANDVGPMGTTLTKDTYGGYSAGDWVNIMSVMTYDYDTRMYNVDYYLNGYKLAYSMEFMNYDKTKLSTYERTNSIANWAPNGGIKTTGWPLETMGYTRLGIMPTITLTTAADNVAGGTAGATRNTAAIDNFEMKVYEKTQLPSTIAMKSGETAAEVEFDVVNADGTKIASESALANRGYIQKETATTETVKVYKHDKSVHNPVESGTAMSTITVTSTNHTVKIGGLDAISGDERYTVVFDGVKDITGKTLNQICVLYPENQDPDCHVFGKISLDSQERTATCPYVNATENDVEYAFIMASYSNKKLSEVKVKSGDGNQSIKANSSGVIEGEPLSKSAVSYQAFLWKDIDSLSPWVSSAKAGASDINDANWIIAPAMYTGTSVFEVGGQNNMLYYSGDIVRCFADKNSNGKFDSGEFTGVKLGAAPLLRKEFTVEKEIASATVDVTGLGYYELFINGKKVGDKVLEPFERQVENNCIYYSTYDVKDMLKDGANAVGAILGRGTYNADPDNDLGMKAIHRCVTVGGQQRLKMMLTIEYTDGTYIQVPTDTTWKATSSPIRFDHQAYGEYYDSRMEAELGWDNGAWADGEFDDSEWQQAQTTTGNKAPLAPAPKNHNAVVNTYKNLSVEDLGNNTFRIDVGRVLTGWARINNWNCATSGDVVALHYIENLNTWTSAHQSSKQHTFYFKNKDGVEESVTTYAQTDRYISHEGVNNWAPRFNFQSFRYVDVTFPDTVSITADEVSSIIQIEEVHANVEETGSFTSSNDTFNKTHAMSVNSMLNNMHSYISDTPLHENAPWLFDGAMTAEWGMMNYDMADYLKGWTEAIRNCQAENGEIAAISPGGTTGSMAPEWFASYSELVWQIYQHTGDLSELTSNYNAMKNQFGWQLSEDYRTKANNDATNNRRFTSGISELPENIYYSFFGDHVPPTINERGNLGCFTAAATAYVYHWSEVMASIADVLGKSDDAEYYRSEGAKIKAAYNTWFWDEDKGYYHEAKIMKSDSADFFNQTPNIIAIDFGIADETQKGMILAHLREDIADLQNKNYSGLAVGVVGLKSLFRVLNNNGLEEELYSMMNSDKYPGYGYWIANGATSMWEHWHTGSRSDNHHMFGYVDAWFYENIAGIVNTSPAYRTSIIKPYILGDMTSARGSINTPYGDIVSDWNVNGDGNVTLTVTIPNGTTSTVYVPLKDNANVEAPLGVTESSVTEDGYKVYEVTGGTYTFVAK